MPNFTHTLSRRPDLFNDIKEWTLPQLRDLKAAIEQCRWSNEKNLASSQYAAREFDNKFMGAIQTMVRFKNMDRYSIAQFMHLSRMIEERILVPRMAREGTLAVPVFPVSKKVLINEDTNSGEIEGIVALLKANGFNKENLGALSADISAHIVHSTLTEEGFNKKYGNVFHSGIVVEPKVKIREVPKMTATGAPILNDKGEEEMENVAFSSTDRFTVGIGNNNAKTRTMWKKLAAALKDEVAIQEIVAQLRDNGFSDQQVGELSKDITNYLVRSPMTNENPMTVNDLKRKYDHTFQSIFNSVPTTPGSRVTEENLDEDPKARAYLHKLAVALKESLEE